MYPIAAERIEAKTITPAPGIGAGAPQLDALTIPSGHLVGIEIGIPPGHKGLSGIALSQSGAQMIPATAGDFIVGDDEVIRWPLQGFHETRYWSSRTFNTDTVAHPFYVRFLLVELVHRPEPPIMPVVVWAL